MGRCPRAHVHTCVRVACPGTHGWLVLLLSGLKSQGPCKALATGPAGSPFPTHAYSKDDGWTRMPASSTGFGVTDWGLNGDSATVPLDCALNIRVPLSPEFKFTCRSSNPQRGCIWRWAL